ncbi:MAG TPA: MFS transporter [Bacilli bacterium]|nr:MFS transporter [Bacilli bacterium]
MRNKWLYLSGTATSAFGDGIQNIAMVWFLLQMTHSPLVIGGLIAVNYLPALLLAPWAGVYADHRDAQKLAVKVDLLRTAGVAVITVLVFFEIHSVIIFYLLQAVLAVGNTLFKPASQALVKETFLDEDLIFVLTKSSSFNLTATFIGTGAAGVLMAISPVFCFVINGLSFLVSALCNNRLQRVNKRTVTAKSFSVRADLQKGWDFIRNTKGMLYLLFLSIISSASLQMSNTLLAPYVDNYLGGSAFLFATLDIAFTVGGVLAGLLVSKALQKWGPYVALITLGGLGVFSLLAGFRPGLVWVVAMIFGLGFFTMFHLVTMQTLIQVNTPKEIIGCVVGLRSIIASSTKISAGLATGFFLEMVDIRYVFWGFTALVVLSLLTSGKAKEVPVPMHGAVKV